MSRRKPPDERMAAITPFGLRMQPDLKARIETAAEESGRSMNAEIIARLEQTFDQGDNTAAPLVQPIAEMVQSAVQEAMREQHMWTQKTILDAVIAVSDNGNIYPEILQEWSNDIRKQMINEGMEPPSEDIYKNLDEDAKKLMARRKRTAKSKNKTEE